MSLERAIKHLPHIVALYAIFLITGIIFVAFSYNQAVQVASLAAAASAYVVWGIIHHLIHNDLTIPVVIEYVAFALLGFVIGISVVLRG